MEPEEEALAASQAKWPQIHPTLDLIIVHHADLASTRECVTRELAELVKVEGVAASRVLVVDNGPTDELGELGQFDNVLVLKAPRRQGFGANVTLAAMASDSDLLLLLNDDAIIQAPSISALVAALDYDAVGAVGPRIVDGEGSSVPSAWHFPDLVGVISFALRRGGPPWVQSQVQRTTRVDVLSGAVLMVRRSTFVDDLGGFDPDFFMFSEDADFCRRLADRGLHRLVVPAATATHRGQASTAGYECRRDVEQWRSRSTYWRKHHSRTARTIIRIAYSGSYLIGALVAVLGTVTGTRRRGRGRRLLFLAGAALRTPPGPGLSELAADWDRARTTAH